MRYFLAVLGLGLFLTSCEEDKGYFLSGEVEGVPDGTTVYVSELENTTQPELVDSTHIENGQFELDMKDVENANLSFLQFEGVNGNVIFISENEKISFDIQKDNLRDAEVSGGKENEVLYQYLDHLKEVNEEMTNLRTEMASAMSSQDADELQNLQAYEEDILDNDKEFKKELVTNNPDSFVSVMVLIDIMNMNLLPAGEIKAMYDELSDDVKTTPLAKNLEENLEEKGTTDIGSKAPDFSAPTPEGDELSLAEAKGKVTIIDFWAAWCKPCRVENPNVVKTYNKYHDDGLNIIGVSLDRPGQKDKWLQAIEEDGLEWQHVSHLEFWQEPVAQLYGIRSIPATFILDEDGVIVARDLRGKDLENKIEELLNR